jgi:TP901 family phage tail tape measure protein
MANIVKVTVNADDKASGTMSRVAKLAKGDLSGSLRGLGKIALGTAGGFIAAQASMAAVSSIMTKSIGAAMKYEHQMAQIQALTGTTEEDTDKLSGSIKELAKTLPKSPAELGAGAYFILSSGIEDVTDAANVLEVAAKASTIGLGETQVVANALTTVLNAYSMEASEAGRVTDIMIEAVKQGKAEAGEFSSVLGRVVPLAAQMGISFEEVAANLATFTRLGVSADEAATGLRQVMASLLKPTKASEEAMGELGFTAEGLRKSIREKGLLATLDDMTTATGGNEAAIAKLFPNIRALTSVLGTAGVQMEGYTDILGATENATGNLEQGMAIMADTAQYKTQMAMQELNLMLMELGEEILPAIVPAMKGVVFAAETMAQALNAVVEPIMVIKDAWDHAFGDLPSETEIITRKLLGMAANAEITKEEFIKLAQEGIGLTASEARKLADDTAFPTQLEVWRAKAEKFGISAEKIDKAWEKAGGNIQREWAAIDKAIAEGDAMAVAFSDNLRDEVAPTAITSLADIRDMADEARSSLTNMFSETTAEEAAAELALANLKLEAGKLEAKTSDLTTAESARLALLNDELIPAQEDSLDLLRLEKDAVTKAASAQDAALPSMKDWRTQVKKGAANVEWLNVALGELPSTIDVKVALGLAQTAELDLIKQAIALGVPTVPMQHGGAVETTRPTLFLASERGQREGHIFTPGGLPQGTTARGPIEIHNHFHGPVLGDRRQAQQFAQWMLPEIERALV